MERLATIWREFCHRKLHQCKREKDKLESSLKQIASPDTFKNITNECDNIRTRAIECCKATQDKKLEKLKLESYKTKGRTGQCKAVTNISDYDLSTEEKEVLSKGLAFVPTKQKIPVEAILSQVEEALTDVPESTAHTIRLDVACAIKQHSTNTGNLSKSERYTIANLSKRLEITVAPADKGNTVVVLNTIDYERECLSQLSDRSTYKEVNRDPTVAWENRTRDFIKNIRSQKPDHLKHIIPIGTNCPRFYGMPKIHKSKNSKGRIPMRPVISFINAPTYRLSKFLAFKLRDHVIPSDHVTKNGADLKTKLENISIAEEETMVSFDVTSLYTSIPINLAIEATVRLLDNSIKVIPEEDSSKEELVKMTCFCLNNSFCTFRGKFYKQISGLPMGAPLSSVLAELVMSEIDGQAVRILGTTSRMWQRYIDDVYAILRKRDLEGTLNKLNSINQSIQFTMELEKNGTLPFLDLNISRQEYGQLSFSVYRKPTHSGKYLDYKSEHTFSQKMSVISSLAYRAMTHCSSETSMNSELEVIKKELMENGYPRDEIQMEINKTKMRFNQPSTSQTQDEDHSKTVSLPFVNKLSQRISRSLKKADIRCTMVPNNTIRDFLRPLKDPVSTEDTSNCIYKINCTECDASYIGETRRRFKSRLTEHKAAVRNANTTDSALATHAIDFLHPPHWDGAKIVAKDSSFRTRRLKEAVEIINQPNPLNRNEGMKIPETFIPIVTKNYNERNRFQNKIPAKAERVRFLSNW
jgi:hypothetical protein